MKGFIKSFFLLGIIYFVGVGCQENLTEHEELRELKEFSLSLNKVPVPEGTEITKVSENESYLNLPEGMFFVSMEQGQNKRLRPLAISGTGVRCKCNAGSGCNPTVMGGDYACVMTTGCSSCELSTSRMGSVDGVFDDNLISIKGLVDYNQGITFLTESLSGDMMQDAFFSTEDKTHGNAYAELFELEEVQRGILKFYNEIYEGNIPQFILDNEKELPKNYSYVTVNLYGSIAVMPFPNKKIQEQSRRVNMMQFSAGISCECHSGNGCKKSSAGMGSVKYCDAGDCTDCELSN